MCKYFSVTWVDFLLHSFLSFSVSLSLTPRNPRHQLHFAYKVFWSEYGPFYQISLIVSMYVEDAQVNNINQVSTR